MPKCRAMRTHNFNDFHSGQRKTRASTADWRHHSTMAICYWKGYRTGNSSRPCWECHNGQELYLLAKSTTVWVITLFLSRNARGDFLLKFWPAAKKDPVQIYMWCVMGRVPPPQTHNQRFQKLPLPRDQHPLSLPSQTFQPLEKKNGRKHFRIKLYLPLSSLGSNACMAI